MSLETARQIFELGSLLEDAEANGHSLRTSMDGEFAERLLGAIQVRSSPRKA